MADLIFLIHRLVLKNIVKFIVDPKYKWFLQGKPGSSSSDDGGEGTNP